MKWSPSGNNGLSVKVNVYSNADTDEGVPPVEVRDGWFLEGVNLMLYRIGGDQFISSKDLVFNQTLDVGVGGFYRVQYYTEDTIIPGLMLVNRSTRIHGLYIPTNIEELNHDKSYRQRAAVAIAESPLLDYGSILDESAPFRHLKRQRAHMSAKFTDLKSAIAWAEFLPRSRITDAHHIHYSAVDAINIAKNVIPEKLLLTLVGHLATKVDFTTSAVAGLILYAVTLNVCVLTNLLNTQFFSVGSCMAEWYKYHKDTSTNYKLHANNVSFSMEQFFEVEVLVNRLGLKMDWVQEKINRTDCRVTLIPDDVIGRYANKLFRIAKDAGKRARKNEWSPFWKKRWEWSTNGASNYVQHNNFIYPGWQQKTKFMTYLQMPSETTLEDILSNTPAIIAKPSEKHEWGKVRAIYGCDDISHLLYTFVMGSPEELLPSWIPLSSSSSDDYVAHLMSIVQTKGYSLCLDYEDFNSQHSVGSMIQVLKSFFEVFGQDLSDSQRSAIPWLFESLQRQYVLPTADNQSAYYTEGTLFSGWRLTTFMNTVLNYCYTSFLIDEARVSTNGTLHSGDDVYMHVSSPDDFSRMAITAEKYGVRLSQSKCFLGSIKEFLRKNHVDKTGSQYLARGVATLVHGRTESIQHADVLEAIKSNETRLQEVAVRGMSEQLINEIRTYHNKNLHKKKGFDKCTPEIIECVYNKHPVNYGINLDMPATGENLLLEKRSTGTLEGIAMPGLHDYVDLLKVYLKDSKNLKRLRGAILNATERVLFSSMVQVTGTYSVNIEERRNMRALYKQYAIIKQNIHYGKCRLVGIDIVSRELSESISLVDKVIKNKENYYEWLSMLV